MAEAPSGDLCFQYHIQKMFAKANVKEFFPYIFIQEFYCFGPYIYTQVDFYEQSKIGIEFHSFHVSIQFPQEHFLKSISFPIEY